MTEIFPQSSPLACLVVKIGAGEPIADGHGSAIRAESGVVIGGSVGSIGAGILDTLMNLTVNEEPLVKEVSIRPDGINVELYAGIIESPERVIGLVEGVVAHALRNALHQK